MLCSLNSLLYLLNENVWGHKHRNEGKNKKKIRRNMNLNNGKNTRVCRGGKERQITTTRKQIRLRQDLKKKQMCENKTIKTTVEGKGKKREKKNSGHVRRKTRTFSAHMCLQCVSHRVILDGVFCFVFLCWPTIARRERREKKSKRKQVFLYRTQE